MEQHELLLEIAIKKMRLKVARENPNATREELNKKMGELTARAISAMWGWEEEHH